MRTTDKSGAQIVVVELSGGKCLTYKWTNRPLLKVGDRVSVPGPFWCGPGAVQEGTVSQLGSDYQGDLVRIYRRLGATA